MSDQGYGSYWGDFLLSLSLLLAEERTMWEFGACATVYLWRSQDNLEESFLLPLWFLEMELGLSQLQSKRFYPLSPEVNVSHLEGHGCAALAQCKQRREMVWFESSSAGDLSSQPRGWNTGIRPGISKVLPSSPGYPLQQDSIECSRAPSVPCIRDINQSSIPKEKIS